MKKIFHLPVMGLLVRGLPAMVLLTLLLMGAAPPKTQADAHVVVTYFHRTLRCHTCQHIEGLARYDVTHLLADEMEAGRLEWDLQNMEAEKNASAVALFELESPSLVVALVRGDEVLKWSRLDRVWDLSEDVEAFDEYVLGTVGGYLDEASVGESGQLPVDK